MNRLARVLRVGGLVSLVLARTASATTVMAPWAQQAEGWLSMVTSVYVPLIGALVTITLLVVNRYMGDQDEWIHRLLSTLIKISLAANAFTLVLFFTGAPTSAPAATVDEVVQGLEGFLP